jgi:hypothetical protein
VEPTVEALAQGIVAVKNGAFTPRPFDAVAYNEVAFQEFLAAAGHH